jgi:RecA-family ATPase
VSRAPTPDEARRAVVPDTSDKVSETYLRAVTSENDTSDTSDRDIALLAAARDGAWLTVQEFPPLRFAVDGLIPEGFTLEVGAPKAGKSWLTLALLLAVACGGVALGGIKAAPARRVFYLALEDSDRRMQDRCRKLLGDGEDIPALFHYQTRIQPGMVLPVIDAWMRRHPDTALIVIDTLGKVMPPAFQGESAYQRDYRVGSALKARADAHPGLGIMALHHDRKAAADDFIDSVSGTHGLAGAADTIMLLCRKRHSPEGLLKVTGRDVPEAEYALTVADGMQWQLDGADLAAATAAARKREDERAVGEKSADILARFREHPEGLRAGDLVSEFGKDIYQYLKRLAAAGRIDKLERGLYILVSEPSEVSETQVSDHA